MLDLPIFLLFLFIILAQWSLIVLLVWKKRERAAKSSITLTEPQSLNILHRAYKKAQEIIGEAELSSVKLHAQSELNVKKTEEELTEETKKKLDEYSNVLTKEGKEQVAKFIEEFKKKSEESINKSLEDYKDSRMKAIDDNISSVVARTVELVLAKKVSPDVQIDLIYEALEQAKEEKLIS
ncbi:hypothetical protein HY310_01380 [Candidatus Microgenomates bacterium]|nr:hypothetical protein [Candidatus Microgenomates bacterium]